MGADRLSLDKNAGVREVPKQSASRNETSGQLNVPQIETYVDSKSPGPWNEASTPVLTPFGIERQVCEQFRQILQSKVKSLSNERWNLSRQQEALGSRIERIEQLIRDLA